MNLRKDVARRLYEAAKAECEASGAPAPDARILVVWYPVAAEAIRLMEWVISEQVRASHGDGLDVRQQVRDHGVKLTLPPEGWEP